MNDNNIRIIRKNDSVVSTWSGGTTTQLYIYPESAVYAERNFRWRLSSAKVDVEESVFTSLPGIARILMIIEGEVFIEHQGHHSTTLKAFEKDSFSGGWTTRCVGKATDFNLMTAEGCSGSMEAFSIASGETKEVDLNCSVHNIGQFSAVTDAFYVIGGTVEASAGTEVTYAAHDGDLLMVSRLPVEKSGNIQFRNMSDRKVNLIRTTIYY